MIAYEILIYFKRATLNRAAERVENYVVKVSSLRRFYIQVKNVLHCEACLQAMDLSHKSLRLKLQRRSMKR